jgi:hypothetical protein
MPMELTPLRVERDRSDFEGWYQRNSMKQSEEIGRLFQDYQFEVTHLRGCIIEKLIGVIANEDRDELQPTLLLLKPAYWLWQRFFLDMGAGFWEQWLATDIEQELADDNCKYVDYAERFALRGAKIREINCQPAGENMNPLISLRLSCGTFLLESQNAHDIESRSIILFH